jgi:multicomponent Na+:H+ antiporter subunit G
MQLALDTLSWISLLAGGAFVLIGGLGLLRLPDFFTRLHAAGLTDTLGMGLVILGLMLQSGWAPATIKLVMIFVFMFITSPTATHALARAALHGKVTPLLTKEQEPGGRDTDQ